MADAEKKAFFELAAKIAAALGDGWVSLGLNCVDTGYGVEEYCYPIIVHPDGREIGFQMGRVQGKLHVGGIWPTYSKTEYGNEYRQVVSPRELRYENGRAVESPSINVSSKRGVKAIVKDIQRRFLPEYTRVWGLCKARVEATTAYNSRCDETWDKVCGAMGKTPTTNSVTLKLGKSWVTFEKGSDDGVGVKTYSMPLGAVLELIAFLKSKGAK